MLVFIIFLSEMQHVFRSRERKHFSRQNKLMRKGLKYRDADVCVQLSFFYFPNLNSSSASLMSLTLVVLRSSSHFLVAEIKLAPPHYALLIHSDSQGYSSSTK